MLLAFLNGFSSFLVVLLCLLGGGVVCYDPGPYIYIYIKTSFSPFFFFFTTLLLLFPLYFASYPSPCRHVLNVLEIHIYIYISQIGVQRKF